MPSAGGDRTGFAFLAADGRRLQTVPPPTELVERLPTLPALWGAGAQVTLRNAAGQTERPHRSFGRVSDYRIELRENIGCRSGCRGFAELADEVAISADDPSLLLSIVLYPQGRGLPGKVTDTSGAAVVRCHSPGTQRGRGIQIRGYG